jgi:hypothetical protein
MITNNYISYNELELQRSIVNFILLQNNDVRFVTEYGSNVLTNNKIEIAQEWNRIKNDLLFEYDGLWRELAKI